LGLISKLNHHNMTTKKKTKIPHPHLFPKEYLEKIAAVISKMRPDENITFNTLKDIYKRGYSEGYSRRQCEVVRFRKSQDNALTKDFNKFRDDVDDMIHQKSNQTKSA
jgi:hypothetical protein